jgi:[ribosomal protein S5]-alanine N-acetyltransferase
VRDRGATVLETERLVLRHLTLDDLDELAVLYRDPEVRRYFPEGTLTYEETREELEWCIDVYDGRYGYGLWATIRKDRDELIGRCGLLPWRASDTPEGELLLEGADEYPVDGATYEIELAYLLGREHWGQGLATEAARAIAHHALQTLRPPRLICLFDPGNVASRRVAERVGFTYDCDVLLDGERVPMHSLRAGSTAIPEGRPASGNH